MSRLPPGWLLRDCEAVLASCRAGYEDLRPYQTDELLPFLLATPKCAAFVDMGLGKTITVLTAISELLARGEVQKVLVIAPKRVAIQTWPTELKLWRHVRWISHSLIRPNPDDPTIAAVGRWAARNDPLSASSARSKAITAEYEVQKCVAAMADDPVHVINREAVEWLVSFHGKRWPYDMVIVDESTSFADHTSKRWKSLARVAQHTKRIVLLSGTPAPEGVQDLFAQIYLLDGGLRFGKGITAFRERYLKQNPYTHRWSPLPGSLEAVTSKIADISIVLKEERYLGKRETLLIERPIVLESAELRKYKEFERTMLLQVDEDNFIEAVNAGVLHGKLLQFASGTVYDQKSNFFTVHDHKIEEVRELLAEINEPVMIAYWFKPSLLRLQKAFPKMVTMDRDGKCVDDWNAGKIQILACHPQSAGHGLNMQLGPGRTIIFFDTPESLELYLQIIGRINRSGQKRMVKIVHLVVQKTIETLAVSKLKNKESVMDAITSRLISLRRAMRKEAA